MQVIRCRLFETNSSSTHSIFLRTENFSSQPSTIPMRKGVVKLVGGHFGWGPEVYTDTATKAAYVVSYLMGEAMTPEEEKAALSSKLAKLLREVVLEELGATEVQIVPIQETYAKWGYIDHQSNKGDSDTLGKLLHSFGPGKKEALRQFIFNQAYVLYIDNDNH
mgnify:CR=1 FL=1